MKNVKNVKVNKENGLNPREMSKLVRLANSFESDVQLEYKGYEIDAKSIMGLLSLLINNGDQVTLTAKGNDSQEAINQIENAITK